MTLTRRPEKRAEKRGEEDTHPPHTNAELGKARKRSLVRMRDRHRRLRDLRKLQSPKQKKKKPVEAWPRNVPMVAVAVWCALVVFVVWDWEVGRAAVFFASRDREHSSTPNATQKQ